MQGGIEEGRCAQALIRSDRLQSLRMLVQDAQLARVRESVLSYNEDKHRLGRNIVFLRSVRRLLRLGDCVAQSSVGSVGAMSRDSEVYSHPSARL